MRNWIKYFFIVLLPGTQHYTGKCGARGGGVPADMLRLESCPQELDSLVQVLQRVTPKEQS